MTKDEAELIVNEDEAKLIAEMLEAPWAIRPLDGLWILTNGEREEEIVPDSLVWEALNVLALNNLGWRESYSDEGSHR